MTGTKTPTSFTPNSADCGVVKSDSDVDRSHELEIRDQGAGRRTIDPSTRGGKKDPAVKRKRDCVQEQAE